MDSTRTIGIKAVDGSVLQPSHQKGAKTALDYVTTVHENT